MKNFVWIVFCLVFFWFTFGQDTNIIPENYIEWEWTKIINQDFDSDNMDALQNVQARFCNNNEITKNLSLDIRPWKKEEICIALVNQSELPVNVLLWFSEWIIKDWANACLADMSNTNNFSKYIDKNLVTGTIIPAKWTIIHKFKYMAPKKWSGSVFGCFGIKINQKEQIKPGKMFLIVPRKVGYIDINITWSVYYFGLRDDIKDIYIINKNNILKGFAFLLLLWIIVTVFQMSKKKKTIKRKK